MRLREDSSHYCMIWMGVMLLSAYYFSFFYTWMTGTIGSITLLLAVLGGPLLLLILYTGFLKPDTGKIKSLMMSISGVLTLLYAIVVFIYHDWALDSSTLITTWGAGSAFLIAIAIMMFPPVEESTSPGIIDTSKLHYPPGQEELVEEEGEPITSTETTD